MRRPIDDHRVTSPYGYRILNGKRQFHDGIDYASNSSSRVYAMLDGVIITDIDYYEHSKRWTDSRHSAGNFLIIKHNFGGVEYYVRYMHLVENRVDEGQAVKEGEFLGNYGNVGYSFGAHLHIDMYDMKWVKIDPTPVILDALYER